MKEAIELCEPMTVVNIKAKVLDVGETQIVSRKQLKMTETNISDGETTSTLILMGERCNSCAKRESLQL